MGIGPGTLHLMRSYLHNHHQFSLRFVLCFSQRKLLAYGQFQCIEMLQVGLHPEKRFFHVD